jgi:hypothetical protein
LVLLNSVGPVFVFALAVPLVVLWKYGTIVSGSTTFRADRSTGKETADQRKKNSQEQLGPRRTKSDLKAHSPRWGES